MASGFRGFVDFAGIAQPQPVGFRGFVDFSGIPAGQVVILVPVDVPEITAGGSIVWHTSWKRRSILSIDDEIEELIALGLL